MHTRANDSSQMLDTVSDSGRGVPTFDSDCPRLSDLTSRFFWISVSSRQDGEAADLGALPLICLEQLCTGHVLLTQLN